MNYALSAVTMLNKLGYDQPTGREWLEKLKQDKNIVLPKTYTEFMELMVPNLPKLLYIGFKLIPQIPYKIGF